MTEHTMRPALPGELQGKRAMVTGSSSGIGRAIALEFAKAGAHVLLHCRANRDGMAAVASSIRELGREVHSYLADLSDPPAQETLVNRVWEEHSGVEIWVNNAGADVLTGEATDWSFERKLEALWHLDVVATIRLSRLVGRRMKQRSESPGSHTVINIGWDQADWGMGGDSGEMFSTAKGAVMAFSRSLAQSLAPEVRVNCLAPGWIRTSWGADASEYWQRRASRESLSGRWGTPEEVARVARFLASPAAEFVSGQVLHVNGGFHHAGVNS
jgi:3-oxoacyl-[acyl-carrier protein] reductase